MKCELCHQADAQRAIRKLVNNEEQELYVCNACAQKQQAKKGKPAKHQKPPPEVMDVLKETLPEIMGMILGATVDFTGNIPSIKDPVCSLCGISRSEYKKAGRFGCAQCYETFVSRIWTEWSARCIAFPATSGKPLKSPSPRPLSPGSWIICVRPCVNNVPRKWRSCNRASVNWGGTLHPRKGRMCHE